MFAGIYKTHVGRLGRFSVVPANIKMSTSGRKIGICWCLLGIFVSLVYGSLIEPSRVKRGIFGTVTSTVYRNVQEKIYVPASCVYVAPNLPECRNVRFLNAQLDPTS